MDRCIHCAAAYGIGGTAQHAENCPKHIPYPAKVSSLGVRRFDATDDPQKLSPRTALEKVLAEYDSDEKRPTHIIVIFGRDLDDGSSGTRFFQAGAYRHHAQTGLVHEAAAMMRESG